jgi:UDP-glucose 4-epimerase
MCSSGGVLYCAHSAWKSAYDEGAKYLRSLGGWAFLVLGSRGLEGSQVGRDRIAGRALLLGGAGFLGSHLLEALLEDGYCVRVFDRVRNWTGALSGSSVEFCEGDFGNRGDLAAALEGCQTAFHLVATTLPKTSNDDPVHDLETNLVSTVRFLDLASKNKLKKIVFASSGGTVYGVPITVPIPEHHETKPVCSYGIHKLAIEQYLHLYHHLYDLGYCALRVSNLFGERQHPTASQGAVVAFLDRALRGEEIEVWGDGSVVRDYVYVKDVARAFCLAARHSGAPRVFNIGSGQGVSVNQLISSIEALLGRPVSRRYLPGRPFDVPVNVLDTSLATDHLNWRPQHTLNDGLRRTLEWLQSSQRAE